LGDQMAVTSVLLHSWTKRPTHEQLPMHDIQPHQQAAWGEKRANQAATAHAAAKKTQVVYLHSPAALLLILFLFISENGAQAAAPPSRQRRLPPPAAGRRLLRHLNMLVRCWRTSRLLLLLRAVPIRLSPACCIVVCIPS